MADWILRIEKGDVLRSRKSGTLRIVRRVKHNGGFTTVLVSDPALFLDPSLFHALFDT